MPSWLTLKLAGYVGAGLAVLLFVGLALHWKSTMTARGEQLATICAATRAAADSPKLPCVQVPQQIAALGATIINVRAATAKAEANDKANAQRVQAQQSQINQESSNAYEARLADARAAAQRLRDQLAAQTHSGRSSASPVSSVPSPAGGPAQSSQDGFSIDDRLTATEQAIQLDELIKWVKKQHTVDVSGPNQ
jgi:hypothetical protein